MIRIRVTGPTAYHIAVGLELALGSREERRKTDKPELYGDPAVFTDEEGTGVFASYFLNVTSVA